MRNRKDNINSEPGYIVRSLLKPRIKPGMRVHLISEKLNIDNTFKVGDVDHSGDNYSNLWETKMKLLLNQKFTPVQYTEEAIY